MADGIGIEQAGGVAGFVALIGVIARWVQQAGRRGDQQSAEAWARVLALLAKAEETIERERGEHRARLERMEADLAEERKRREAGDKDRAAMRAELEQQAQNHARQAEVIAERNAVIEKLTKERDETRERLFAQLLGAMDRKDS